MADSSTTTATIEPGPSSPAISTAPATVETPVAADPARDQRATIEKVYKDLEAKRSGESAGPARGADGKFQPKADSAVATAQPPVTATPPVVSDPRLDAETTAREERALTALRRAQVPKSVLDGLDDAARLDWGTKLAESQAKTDAMIRGKGASETRTDPKAGKPAQADPAAGTPQAAADLSVMTARLADMLALDDEGRKTLDGALSHVAQMASAPLVARLDSYEQVSEQQRQLLGSMVANTVRAALGDEFPELRDAAIWPKVEARAERFVESGAYDHVSDLIERYSEATRDAVGIECRNEIRARSKEATQNRNDKRGGGQPDLGDRRTDATKVLGDDPLTYAGALLVAGRDKYEVKRLVEQRFG